MSDSETDITADSPRSRDRSPSFPIIGIGKALERTRELFEKAKRHEVRVADAAADWGFAPKSSSTLQTIAALVAYGLIEASSGGETRKIKVSDMGWRVLEDRRPGVRDELIATAALRPKLIAQYAELWSGGRPDDSHAISQLKFDSGLVNDAATRFLRVFDENIGFTKSAHPDKVFDSDQEIAKPMVAPKESVPIEVLARQNPGPRHPAQTPSKAAIMEGERELTTGLLSKGSSFRLLVSGKIGEKEIDRLIRKLELDKEILADQDDDEDPPVRADDGEA